MATFADNSNPVQQPSPKGEIKKKRKKPTQNAPAFDLRHELERITGVDLTRIDGIEVMVAQTVLSEVGLDMSRWKTKPTFPLGWDFARTAGSVATESCAEARGV